MKYLRLRTTDPYLNLAIEEYLFLNSQDDIFIIWQNEPTVVIGKNQNAYAEINRSYLNEHNIKVARRITGGGAVFHDLGNVNYTFISSNRGGIDFEYFTKPIIEALGNIGLKCQLSGRNDILADGSKISGNAQYSSNDRVLHHGTLLFDSDLSVLSSVLHVDKEKISAKALKSVRSRVSNIKDLIKSNISTSEFIKEIESFVVSKFSPDIIDAPSCREIDELYKRNSSAQWIYPDREYLSAYNFKIKRRFDFGIVEISMRIASEIIRSVSITGDFFELRDIKEAEDSLIGVKLCDNFVSSLNIDIGDYINGMTNYQLESLILDR